MFKRTSRKLRGENLEGRLLLSADMAHQGGDAEELLMDFGDAPATFPTLVQDNGARHQAIGPRLGQYRDVESDGRPSPDALSDDFDGTPFDDEDGVLFGVIRSGSSVAALNVELQNANGAFVDAWLDLNRDGVWDASENIVDHAPVVPGLQTLNYNIPSDLTSGDLFARVRLSSVGGLDPFGPATDGEVEDYRVAVNAPVVESVIVNDNTISRSQVTSLTVTFSEEVSHAGLQNAFIIYNRTTTDLVSSIHVQSIDAGGKTIATLTFSGDSTHERQGAGSLGSSLSDGWYELYIVPSDVVAISSGIQMVDEFVFGASERDDFFRLFGDTDGDADVDGQDYGRFGLTFLKSSADAAFNPALDFDGDGDVDGQDYGRFGLRFLSSLPF